MDKENVVPGGGDKAEGSTAAAAAAATVPASEQTATPAATATSTTATEAPAAKTAVRDEDEEDEDEDEDEEESDWEDLDEVLDDFSKKDLIEPDDKLTAQQPPTTAAAAATDTASPAPGPSQPPPQDADGTGMDEEAFLKQLEASMAEMVGGPGAAGAGGAAGTGAAPAAGADQGGIESKMEEQWDALEKQLEASGMQPEELLKQLMGDMLNLGGDGEGAAGAAGAGAAPAPAPAAAAAAAAAPAGDQSSGSKAGGEEDFQTKIQRTMERMQDSGDRATSAVQGGEGETGVGDELLEKMLKAMESGAGGEGGEADLMKVFMEMMEDLSQKEMLYEPMKELHTKFGPWLKENKGKVEEEEMERFELQARIVEEIVNKFDEPGFSDQNPDDKAYIWERMQKMQDAGNPPDELVQNPVTDEVKSQLGEGAACPQQ